MPETGMTIRELKRTDRCDRCGAATAVALHFDNGELMFCGHHYSLHHESLESSTAFVCGVRKDDD